MAENKPKTSAERQRIYREKRKKAGFVRQDVFAHPDDWPEIRKLEKKLQKARMKEQKKTKN